MAKFTFKSLLEDIKNDGYYDNKEAFTSLVIGKFEPWINGPIVKARYADDKD